MTKKNRQDRDQDLVLGETFEATGTSMFIVKGGGRMITPAGDQVIATGKDVKVITTDGDMYFD
ncbi:hypothetical protein [Streptosporangium saharense]|uniref:Branched-subunit amino acid aminotransferase/4-amino-4-deoxychorismate lyase n=1 Tax=Streptosporangium saharense TaxID=1706840 RepID=A0A7W7VSA8_9ACTN|nr:hypothetical protein [Streptosporangium saharense]MBB4920986.1 branched-subunit amino acid aminotransferase/4-amino-4-deoxychorismate lyase [Streptosporangium saharense]